MSGGGSGFLVIHCSLQSCKASVPCHPSVSDDSTHRCKHNSNKNINHHKLQPSHLDHAVAFKDSDRPNPPHPDHPDHSDHQDLVQLSHQLHPWASLVLVPDRIPDLEV